MDRDEFRGKDLVGQNLALFDMLNEILDKLGRTEEPDVTEQPVVTGPYVHPKPFDPLPTPIPMPLDLTPPTIGCRVCGLKIEGTGGYVCSRIDCPTGNITYVKD